MPRSKIVSQKLSPGDWIVISSAFRATLDDAIFYDASGDVFRGRAEIDRIAGILRATNPDYRYQTISEPEEVGYGGRVRWVLCRKRLYHRAQGQDCRGLPIRRSGSLTPTRFAGDSIAFSKTLGHGRPIPA